MSSHLFHHNAMNTVFHFRFDGVNQSMAKIYASDCFELLDQLESDLSRYQFSSDVSRINNLQDEESILISENTYHCMLKAMEVTAATDGLFDISIGSVTKNDGNTELKGELQLIPNRPEVRCVKAGREIDLGGIGKGFALDVLKNRIMDHGVESFVLSAGASTHLVYGAEQKFDFSGKTQKIEHCLKGGALSISGINIQGAHVLNPKSAQAPDYQFSRVWVLLGEATYADAISTACLLMNEHQIKELIGDVEDFRCWVEDLNSKKIFEIKP